MYVRRCQEPSYTMNSGSAASHRAVAWGHHPVLQRAPPLSPSSIGTSPLASGGRRTDDLKCKQTHEKGWRNHTTDHLELRGTSWRWCCLGQHRNSNVPEHQGRLRRCGASSVEATASSWRRPDKADSIWSTRWEKAPSITRSFNSWTVRLLLQEAVQKLLLIGRQVVNLLGEVLDG